MTNHSNEKIRSEFQKILVDALRVDPTEITLDARIFGDLEAESIDILDIQFQIERAFGLNLDQNELIANLGEGLSVREIDDKLTVQWCLDFIERRLEDPGATET